MHKNTSPQTHREDLEVSTVLLLPDPSSWTESLEQWQQGGRSLIPQEQRFLWLKQAESGSIPPDQ